MRQLLALFLTAFCPWAMGMSTWSTDVSDLWWNPAESGWGVNLIQQSDKVFATFFLYGSDRRARWYVSSDMQGESAGGSGQPIVFRGALYETSGPVVAGSFDPSSVTRRLVGSVTFEFHPPGDALLTYTIDGLAVSKSVTRQTWALNEVAGDYWVKRVARSACNGGIGMNALGRMAVRRSGSAVTLSGESGTCQYSGNYSQQGRMGRISGTYSCADGAAGPFTLSEIEVSDMGFTARYQATERGCSMEGNFGGPRATASFPPS
ncbi:MAG TPA: hypothetical protein VEC19_03635 [Usitatibacter sp.]|nr:hypothetical protein [Usitatibacter sp.]